MQGDQRDRLAQTHVVGEAGTQTEGRHACQPVQAAQLVVAQLGGEGLGLADGLHALRVGEPFAHRGQPPRRLHVDPLPADLSGACQCGAERVDRSDLVILLVAGAAELCRIDQYPLIAQAHHRTVRLREAVQLRPRQLLIAERKTPVEGQEGIGRQEGRCIRGELVRALVVTLVVIRRADDCVR